MMKLLILLVLEVNMGLIDCQDNNKNFLPVTLLMGGFSRDYCPPGTPRTSNGTFKEEFNG